MIELFILLLAGSLENLENELDASNSYRAELERYLTSHNITLPRGILPYTLSDSQLEAVVKEHMANCKDGDHDIMVAMWKNDTISDNRTRAHMLGQFGDC